jgi:hypothetical protein
MPLLHIKKGPFPAGPSRNIHEKVRESGLSRSPPAGPTYLTVRSNLYNENDFEE